MFLFFINRNPSSQLNFKTCSQSIVSLKFLMKQYTYCTCTEMWHLFIQCIYRKQMTHVWRPNNMESKQYELLLQDWCFWHNIIKFSLYWKSHIKFHPYIYWYFVIKHSFSTWLSWRRLDTVSLMQHFLS